MLVAIMFDVPLDEIDHLSFEPPPEYPNGLRVELHLKGGETREHLAKNDDAWTCAVEIAGITGAV
jgi:hypothetical protein